MHHHRPTARNLVTVATGLLAALLVSLATAQAAHAAAGIHLHLLWDGVEAGEVDRQIDRAANANAGILRVDVGWASLEPDRKGAWSAYHLKRLDAVVDKAEQRGVKLLLTLADTPCWASSAPVSLKGDCSGAWWEREVQRHLPSDPADYGDALAHIAARYGDRVAAWEMWNEPNHDYFLRGPRKAERYAELVKTAYPIAKPAAGAVPLLAGALSMSDHEFTDALYREGIRGSFDAFSIHPYSQDDSPLDPLGSGDAQYSFVRGVPAVRDVMLRHGDDKPLWLTEFGWTTNSVRGSAAWRNGVAEATQATFVRQALTQAKAWDYVPHIIAYNLVDLSSDRTERGGNFGLVRHDGTAKPALAAFGEAAANTAGAARPVAPSLELAAPGTGQAPVSSLPAAPKVPSQAVAPAGSPTAELPEGAASSTRLRGDDRRRLVATRAPNARIRASGRAPGARRVTVDVRRSRGGKRALRLRVRVSASGAFRTSFRAKRLAPGAYRVTVDAGAGATPTVLLKVT